MCIRDSRGSGGSFNTGTFDAWRGNSPSLFLYSTEAGNTGPAVDTGSFEYPATGTSAQYLYNNLAAMIEDADGDGEDDATMERTCLGAEEDGMIEEFNEVVSWY